MLNASGGDERSTYLKKADEFSEGEAMSICGDEHQERTVYGCLFCRVGCEDHVVEEIQRDEPDVRLISPLKIRYNRGKRDTERVPLFPGYVFFCVSPDKNISKVISHRYVYRVLTYADNDWHLVGADQVIVEKLFMCNGVIDFSKAYYENDRIRIADGFLKEYEGCIKKVNHRMKTALVAVEFANVSLNVWLGFELLESQ